MIIGILQSDPTKCVKLNIHSNLVLLENADINTREPSVKYKMKFDFRGFMITQVKKCILCS